MKLLSRALWFGYDAGSSMAGGAMIRARKIRLDPTVEQAVHFARAAGTARFAWNWALEEWQRQYKAGEKPNATKLKARWNAIRRTEFPWSLKVTKCASGQAIINLGTAFANFFRDRKKGKGRKAGYPKFKKKGHRDAFAIWNDQFEIRNKIHPFGKWRGEIRIPNLGWVRMREALTIDGRILGAVVSRDGSGWAVSIQCESPDPDVAHANPGTSVGVDLGISTLMTLSRPLPDGRTAIENPKALRKAMGRVRKMSRRISRQEEMRKKRAAKASRRMKKRRMSLAKLHQRVTNIRRDALHKATTALADTFETIVLEDLNVSGMAKNHRLAGAIHDASLSEIRRQITYKAEARGGQVVIADRFFPSSKTCSACGGIVDKLPLSVRIWRCEACCTNHDRDLNAALNLERVPVGPAWPEPPPIEAGTPGESSALAASQGAVKPCSLNRELKPGALVRTN